MCKVKLQTWALKTTTTTTTTSHKRLKAVKLTGGICECIQNRCWNSIGEIYLLNYKIGFVFVLFLHTFTPIYTDFQSSALWFFGIKSKSVRTTLKWSNSMVEVILINCRGKFVVFFSHAFFFAIDKNLCIIEAEIKQNVYDTISSWLLFDKFS